MKIRTGFVSNSSSSSFLIYGVSLESDIILEKLNLNEDTDVYDLLSNLLESKGFEIHLPYGDSPYYIGKSWQYVGDNQTGLEFKKQIENELIAVLGSGLKFNSHKESWYNG